jgi:hypothetical protein
VHYSSVRAGLGGHVEHHGPRELHTAGVCTVVAIRSPLES